MFKFLASKKGYTLVELIIVLLLLTLGSVALMNLLSVAHRSYDKSEERYRKQEAVKEVALMLQGGSDNVAAAKNADIFNNVEVVPAGAKVDDSFSYLFAEEVFDEKGAFKGFYIYNQNKGVDRASASKLSEIPMYIEIKPYFGSVTTVDSLNNKHREYIQYNSVVITLAALEDDYERYVAGSTDPVPPTSDDIYYSVDVAYHFPNMATSVEEPMVNHKTADQLTSAEGFNQSSGESNGSHYYAIHCEEQHLGKESENITCPMKAHGKNCSKEHCGCTIKGTHLCLDCSCACPGKRGVVLRVYCDSILSDDNTESTVTVPSMCFIATASYGLDTGEVGALCAFRDECLKKSALGRAFIEAYYTVSPPIAEFISESEPLKAAVRTALKPVIVVAQYALDESIRVEGIASFAVIMLSGACATALLMKVEKNCKKAKRSK